MFWGFMRLVTGSEVSDVSSGSLLSGKKCLPNNLLLYLAKLRVCHSNRVLPPSFLSFSFVSQSIEDALLQEIVNGRLSPVGALYEFQYEEPMEVA